MLITRKLLRLSDPSKPTSPRQTYVLTDEGFTLLEDRKKGLFTDQDASGSQLGPSATDQARPFSAELDPSPTDQAAASAGNLVTPAVTELSEPNNR